MTITMINLTQFSSYRRHRVKLSRSRTTPRVDQSTTVVVAYSTMCGNY